MKYIITENRLHNIISTYEEEKDFVDKDYFDENDRLQIYLQKSIPRASIDNLAYEIQRLFNFKKSIAFFRPSKTEGYYLMFAQY